jgi:tetratricopeptide (TPR) repeat protein/transglutaminase-like putative cysteine protease
MLLRYTVAVLFCLAGPGWLQADEWPVQRGPSREPFPHQHDPKTPVPKAFLEDAAACIVYSGVTYLVEEDGTVETITHEITRLNSRKGIERLGEYRAISYDPTCQKLMLHEARVLKPDGKVVAIEPRHVHLRDVSTDYQVYDRDKQLVISFPNLEIGDMIEVKWTTRGKNPEYAGQFFTRYTFGDDRYPTVRDELRVRVPKSKDFKFTSVNGRVPPTIREEGKTRLYQWTVSDWPALPLDENLPSRETLRLQVACSTFGTWAAVGQWKQKLRAKCWSSTPEIREAVREVTKGLTDPMDKARALTYWVRKRIRYVSVSASGSGYTPQLPARVLANRYGDCKDQSQLLAVMLREAGLHVELVTLGALDDGQILPELPMPWGTHAILLVTIDGQQHWIDTTVTNSAWNFLPRDDRDRIAYVTDDGAIRLLRTPKLTASDNRTAMTTYVRMLADGTTWCKRTATYHGNAAMTQRDVWFEAALGERRRLLTAELQDANSRTRLRWLRVEEASLVDCDGPVRAEMEFEIPSHFSGTSDKEGSLTDSKVWNRFLGYTLDYDRKVALDLGSPFESVHRYVVQLPPAYRFDGLPRERKIHSPWGSFRVQVKAGAADPRRLEIIFRFRLETTLVEPADFPAFRKFHDEAYKAWRVWLNVTPTQDPGDIAVLAAHFLGSPDDRASAAVLARLLRDQGFSARACQVLRLARLFQPKDAALWELSVKYAPTLEEVERTYRLMVERFPDQLKYAVQLGGARAKLGDLGGARKVLEPLANKAPEDIRGQAHLELARLDLAEQKPEQALEHLLAARAEGMDSSHNVQVALLQGATYEQLQQPEQAGEAYRKALKYEADNETALGALVRLELAAGRRANALDFLRRFTLAAGDSHEGLAQAAAWYFQAGSTDDALALALRARNLKFTARTQRLLGLIYAGQGDHAKAVLHLSRADLDSEVLVGLLRGYLALGKLREAIETCEMCVKAKDLSEPARAAASVVSALAERRAAYLRAPRRPATKQAAWLRAIDAFLCAELAHEEGKTAVQVEQLLAVALNQGVDCSPAYALRGLLHLERGKLTKALADAERALALDAWEARAYFVRGRVRLERGDKDALLDLGRAARLTQRCDGHVLHSLAAALFQAGKCDEGLATQREAATLLPHDTEIQEQLQELEKAAKVGRSGESNP